MAARVRIDFTNPAVIQAGSIAARLMVALLEQSQHGEIYLKVKDGYVVASHQMAQHHYSQGQVTPKDKTEIP